MIALGGCDDVTREFRRVSGAAQESASETVIKPQMDELCARARADKDLDFEGLMQGWSPSTSIGEEHKKALQSFAAAERYTYIVHVTGEDGWACPELEPVVQR